jgi:uncharacterized protein (TIGR02246 family)
VVSDHSRTIDALTARRAAWVAAVCARDIERYVALLTPDIVWFPPGADAISGRDDFRAWVGPFFERFAYDFSLGGVTCRVAGSHARELGEFRSVLTPLAGGKAMQHQGRYLVLWRHDPDAGWRIDRYVDLTSAVG